MHRHPWDPLPAILTVVSVGAFCYSISLELRPRRQRSHTVAYRTNASKFQVLDRFERRDYLLCILTGRMGLAEICQRRLIPLVFERCQPFGVSVYVVLHFLL